MSKQLKPCPLEHSTIRGVTFDYGMAVSVRCGDCGCRVSDVDTEAATLKWNTRIDARPDLARKVLAEIRAEHLEGFGSPSDSREPDDVLYDQAILDAIKAVKELFTREQIETGGKDEKI